MEEEVNFNLVLKWVIGLAIDESPPDASSLTRFRDRLGEELFTNIFNQIVKIAREKDLFSSSATKPTTAWTLVVSSSPNWIA